MPADQKVASIHDAEIPFLLDAKCDFVGPDSEIRQRRFAAIPQRRPLQRVAAVCALDFMHTKEHDLPYSPSPATLLTPDTTAPPNVRCPKRNPQICTNLSQNLTAALEPASKTPILKSMHTNYTKPTPTSINPAALAALLPFVPLSLCPFVPSPSPPYPLPHARPIPP